jgi:hypothetical protein
MRVRKAFASPAAARLAHELGLGDVAIVGTGRDGRVTIGDVRRLAPVVPAGLGEAGAAFWLKVRRDWRLRPDEEQLLLAACRTIDELERLQAALAEASPVVPGSRGQERAHPLVRELREHRLALKQLLGAAGIGIAQAGEEDDEHDYGVMRSHAGRQLARQRWSRPRG